MTFPHIFLLNYLLHLFFFSIFAPKTVRPTLCGWSKRDKKQGGQPMYVYYGFIALAAIMLFVAAGLAIDYFNNKRKLA